jgi:hypothetical protein
MMIQGWTRLLIWTVGASAVMYMLLTPNGGLLFRGSTMNASLMLIGLGVCLQSRRLSGWTD